MNITLNKPAFSLPFAPKTGGIQTKPTARLDKTPAFDTVRFGAQTVRSSAQAKVNAYAYVLLSKANKGKPLRQGQSLKITVDSQYLPVARKVVEAAYKTFKSGRVSVKVVEPELEALKKKYGITEKFESTEVARQAFEEAGGAEIKLNNRTKPYQRAGLNEAETQKMKALTQPKVSPAAREKLDIDPDEILFECLGLKKGQPVAIRGTREHLPQILKLAERAFQTGTKLFEASITENRQLDPAIPFYRYASDEVLTEVPAGYVEKAQEYIDKNVGRVVLVGSDPEQLKGLNPSRVQAAGAAQAKAVKDIRNQLINAVPWTLYYAPTTVSSKAAGYATLEEAAVDSEKINRKGALGAHIERLTELKNKVNALVQQGYRTIHFVSHDPETGQPDGKTDLKVGLSEKSKFCAAQLTTTRGQVCMANVPSEEVFSTPDWTKTNGVVSATLPLAYNGNLIEDIQVTFKDGQIARDADGKLKISASKNEAVFRELIEQNENADKLGEVALVAGSPIFDLGRVFKSTLLDENATCHIAIGQGYSECVEGANDIKDPKEQKAYLDQYNCNNSTSHVDFMIGGPNVTVYAEKDDGAQKVLIENNAFQI